MIFVALNCLRSSIAKANILHESSLFKKKNGVVLKSRLLFPREGAVIFVFNICGAVEAAMKITLTGWLYQLLCHVQYCIYSTTATTRLIAGVILSSFYFIWW